MKLNLEEIKAFLPHRDPFLFVDEVKEIYIQDELVVDGKSYSIDDTQGARVVSTYTTKKDHPIFAGHFPDHPILPGVVQVEMMAQASSFGLYPTFEDKNNIKMDVALLTIVSAKFRKPIFPEMELVIKTICTKKRGPMITCDCEIYHEEQLMSQASTMARISF